jgi:hypothetical protein
MKKRPEMPKILGPEEIKKELKSLKIHWDKIKASRKDRKTIERQFKEVNNYLKQSEIPRFGDLSILYASNALHILKINIHSSTLNYNEAFLSVNTSEKIAVFMDHQDTFTDEEYWRALSDAYIQQNYNKIPYKVYHELFSAKRAKREKLMDAKELNLFKKLPDQITIYRGGSKTEEKTKKFGVSWTLDKNIAKNFAKVKAIRDKKKMVVIEKTISKKEVIAYFISRKEEEIIYLGK